MRMTPRVIRLAVCQRYFRITEILKHGPIVGKQIGKGAIGMCWSERMERMLTF